jgi:hypothetical protein
MIRIGETEIEGRLTIAHVTEEFSSGVLCGAEFEPATEFDQRRLATLIDEFQHVPSEEDDGNT